MIHQRHRQTDRRHAIAGPRFAHRAVMTYDLSNNVISKVFDGVQSSNAIFRAVMQWLIISDCRRQFYGHINRIV